MSRNAFFNSRSDFFDPYNVVKNKLKGGLSWSVLLSTTITRHSSFPKHFLVMCMLSEFAIVFERKVWRVHVAHLHNAASALSSPSRCFQLLTNPDKDFFLIFDIVVKKQVECRTFSVALVKFHWFGINWHAFLLIRMQKLLLIIIIQKIAPQAESSKYGFFPRFGEKKWRLSEHAHTSYPGLSFRPPGFSPHMGREERRVQGLD